MKKIITIIAVLATITTVASAQGYRNGTFVAVNAAGTVLSTPDTTTNADTTYLWDGRTDHNQWSVISYLFQNAELTGTVTSSMIVQGSNDATSPVTGNWFTIINDGTHNVSAVDTATTADTYFSFNIKNCPYKYLRIRNITGGTQTSVMDGKFYMAAPYQRQL